MDQVMFVMQAGNNRHEHVCESMELFARGVLPRFVEGRDEKEAAKADRLAAAVDKALTRRTAPRGLPAPYQVNEDAEAAVARRSAHVRLGNLAGHIRRSAPEAMRERGQGRPPRLVCRAA